MDINKLIRHLENEGFVIDCSKINDSGKWNHVPLVDNSRGKKSGSFKIINNVCIFHNFKTGITKTYFDDNVQTRDEIIDFNTKVKQYQKEIRDKRFNSGKEAYHEFIKLRNTCSSPYLEKKNIKNFGCKVDNAGVLYVPYRNEKGYISTYQKIFPDGRKYFKFEGEISGSSHIIGFSKINPINYTGKLFVVEGYATGASIYMATNEPTIVCGNSSNMIKVIKNISNKHKNAEIIICADNDLKLVESEKDRSKFIWKNHGVENALKINNEIISCKIVVPEFNNSQYQDLSDFNDVHCTYGLSEVIKQINTQLINRENSKCQEM